MSFKSNYLLVILGVAFIFITACETDNSSEEEINKDDHQKYEKEIEENALEAVPDSL